MGRAYEVRKASIQKTGMAKAKVYSNMSKEIYLAAKGGVPEIDSNIVLKRVVEKAKKLQVPNEIIERAIKKAQGGNNEDYKEVIYEGFGPGNSTLIVKCLTDNVNRTVADVREAFNKTKSKIGVLNSVSYNYDNLGILSFKANNGEEIFEKLLDNNIEIIDYEMEDGMVTISSKPNDIHDIKDVLESIDNFEFEIDEIGSYPHERITLDDENLEIFKKLLSLLDNIDDVSNVYHNVNL